MTKSDAANGQPLDASSLGYRPCVGIMVVNRQGLIWIGCRADAQDDPEGRGAWWQMPQGGIDEHEYPRAAALRELYEETGIRSVSFIAERAGWINYDLPPDLLGKAWGGRYRGQKQKWFALRFTGEDSEINIVPPDPANVEFVAWRWAPLSEVHALIVPFKRAVYDAVLADFAPFVSPSD
ncbi:MAG TPA: RNA pyrophosphohydrolase [Hyphomicrobium sp.]|nr:RNA pyrophosphohydrolase [Hyphomicrobium sp.]